MPIDATGWRAVLARAFGAPPPDPVHRSVGMELRHGHGGCDLEFWARPEECPDGVFWAFPVRRPRPRACRLLHREGDTAAVRARRALLPTAVRLFPHGPVARATQRYYRDLANPDRLHIATGVWSEAHVAAEQCAPGPAAATIEPERVRGGG